MRHFLVLGLGLLSAPLLAEAQAGDAPAATTIAAPSGTAIDPFQQAIAARAVADFARRQQDPQAMLVAARMLQEIPLREPDAATPPPAGAPPAFTPAALYAEARGFAKGDPVTLAQIRVAESSGSRGVLSSAFGKGLVRLVHEVAAQAAYRFTISATGGQILRIGAIGDLGTSMLMRLVDAAGRVVCVDDSGSYAPVCATTPRATASYRVEIVNHSARPSNTVILSN